MTDRDRVKLMSDYFAGWPLWGSGETTIPSASDVSPELATRLNAWQEFFEERFHWQHGWRSAGDSATYATEGHELHRLLTAEIGGWADVELDLWPVPSDEDHQHSP